MVVEHGQQMAAGAGEEREVALEVHLPELVGRLMFKALPRALRAGGLRINQPGAAQDAGDSARRQLRTAFERQPSRQLASAPTAAHLPAQADHVMLDLWSGAQRRAPRPARAIFQTAWALSRIALKPLVAGLRCDPEAPAKLAPICTFLHRQLHKLLAQRHPGNLPPRHPAYLPLEVQHAA